jgi:two-component system, NarL family, response regulator DevR
MTDTRTVLVVDDYAPSRYAFRRILAGRYAVREVGDVASAWLALTAGVDALLLDVNLPDGSGIDFCREVRERFPRLPVVLISASYRAASQSPEWQTAGASAFLEQPVSADELLRTLDNLLDSSSRPDS